MWQDYTEMGLTALPFAEELGGIGGGPVEMMIVMEAIGRGLCLEPFLSTVVLGGTVVRLGGSGAQVQALIPPIIAGELILALAYGERQSRYDLFDVATTARRNGDGFVLDGQKSVVLHGDSADKLIVSARTSKARAATRAASRCFSSTRTHRPRHSRLSVAGRPACRRADAERCCSTGKRHSRPAGPRPPAA